MSKAKLGPCKDEENFKVETEEVGVYRGPPEEFKFRYKNKAGKGEDNIKTQTDPISVQTPPSIEMPFSDEDEDGPNSFTYYTVPAVVSEVADGRAQAIGIDRLMPQTKKLAVKGELSDREKQVFRYFRRRMIMDLLQFMMNHLLAAEPDDPIDFLRGLLDQCLLFRSGHLKEPPILYGPEHLESVFKAFDPLNTNVMTTQQYTAAMRTLMVRNYNKYPEKNSNGDVPKRSFMSNAKVALVESLLDLILLAPSVTEPPPKAMAVDTTPAEKPEKLTMKEEMKQYMKSLLKGKRAAEEAEDSPDEIVELEGIKKPPLITPPSQKPEKFGEYARPIKHLQDAFKPSPELHF
uniref:EF-hand calcium-binding domain-containing protein 10 n=1 Tax=Lygus hesperus TaxID=30085 RepID=A0A0A9YS92_LYGHE